MNLFGFEDGVEVCEFGGCGDAAGVEGEKVDRRNG